MLLLQANFSSLLSVLLVKSSANKLTTAYGIHAGFVW